MDSDKMGRFGFDGAENIAFWVEDDDGESAIDIRFDELETLKAFLHHNFPGLFEKTQGMKYRAERAEYIIARVEEELEGFMDSLDDHVTREDIHEGLRQVWSMVATPFAGHLKADHDGIPVCLTCPKNSIGYPVAWGHLHETSDPGLGHGWGGGKPASEVIERQAEAERARRAQDQS